MRKTQVDVFAAVLVAICLLSPISTEIFAETEEDRTAQLSREARKRYNSGMEKGDLSDYIDMWALNAVSRSPLGVRRGKEEIGQYYTKQVKSWKVAIKEKWQMVKGSTIVSVFLWDAIHRPSGRPLTLEIAAIYEYNREGKRQDVSYYFDTAKLLNFIEEVKESTSE